MTTTWSSVVVRVVVIIVAVCATALPAAADGGLRATGRVRAVEPGPAVSLALGTGYGFTEQVLDENDAHHRIGGWAALAVRATRWLELGGEVRGRYDKHTGDNPDDGFVGDPRFWATAMRALSTHEGGGTWLGFKLGLWLPGDEVPSIKTDAISLDGSAIVSVKRGALTFSGSGGFRLDNSGKSIENRMISFADKLGLGISDYDAILIGAGVTRSSGGLDVFGELSWDVLVGDGAPSAMESPLRVGLGVRTALDDSVTLEGQLEVTGSSRPVIDETLVNVEPRVSAIVGLSWRPRPARTITPIIVEKPVDPDPIDLPPAPTTGTVKGRIADPEGAPLPGATVRLGARSATTGDDGTFTLDDVTPGSVDVLVERPGHEPTQRTLTITAGAEAQLDVTLARVKPPSQIRGLVRSFDGKGLGATVRVEPVGLEVTAGPDGSFQVDVPPGTYTIVVSMPGYETQKKDVAVEDQGVAVKNIELRKARK
jgi:hypothetical protein